MCSGSKFIFAIAEFRCEKVQSKRHVGPNASNRYSFISKYRINNAQTTEIVIIISLPRELKELPQTMMKIRYENYFS